MAGFFGQYCEILRKVFLGWFVGTLAIRVKNLLLGVFHYYV